MQGFIGQELWDDIAQGLLILPEHGWTRNFIKHVQTEYNWTLETANRFIAWCEAPGVRENTLEYMKLQAAIFFQNETQTASQIKATLESEKKVPGFEVKCDDCKVTQFVAHYDQQQAIEIFRNMGWLIRGTGNFGPDSCPICKLKLERAVGRKIRGDGGYA